MEIFGLSPLVLTLIICVAGIALRVYIGRIKNANQPFNIHAVILSFMIGIIVSVGLVAPVINAIPQDYDELIILPLIAGQIIVVMKSESISTAARNLVKPAPKPGGP
jgi:uncharacterized membrane protein